MAIKLLLNPAAEARACTHPGTGVRFMIRPITPERYAELRRAAMKGDGEIDVKKWNGSMAVEVIADWGQDVGDKNGPLPCTDENKRIFGCNQAANIMPWVTDQACSLDHYRLEEEQAAKNA
jgi:hypothetical protein